jgi:nucleoside-diphosphate-sugar epimerase
MLLVTGGFGLVGSNAARHLSALGFQVLLLDRSVNKDSDFFQGCSGIEFVEGDILDPFLLAKIFSTYPIQGIIHSAANVNGQFCKSHPTQAFETNTKGTLHLLEIARLHEVNKFIYISSASVFGKQANTDPIGETALPTPMNMYATTKKMSEELVRSYRVIYGMETVIVRISWVFGPIPELREPRWSVGPIPYYTWKILTENKLVESSGIDFLANFTSVDDVSHGIHRILDTRDAPEVVHLSSEQLYSNKQIVQFLRKQSPDSDIRIGDGMDPFVQQAPLRGALVSESKDRIGYQPKADFNEALEKYYKWMKNELLKRESSHA